MRPASTATSAARAGTPAPSTSVPPLMIRSCTASIVSRRPRARPPGVACGESDLGFAQDPVHLGAAHRAGALCRAAPVGQFDFLPVELTLLPALHAVPLVVSHGNS